MSKCGTLVLTIGDISIEPLHQGASGRVIRSPEGRDYRLRAGKQERADEVGDALLTLQRSDTGVTGRKGNEIRIQAQVSDLAHLEQTVFARLWIASKNERG